MTEIKFFLPGPTYVREDVRQAMTGALVGHRSEAFKQLYSSMVPRLQQIMRTTGDVMFATGSATLVMESAVVSTVDREVLNLTCGAFSERWHSICLALGKSADTVSVPWGEAVDPDLVRAALRRKRYEAVTLVHNETSTGVINPLAELSAVVREESDALLLVDTVSSLGGARVETDLWDLDVVLASTQKALAAPPGVTVFSMSARAAERASGVERRGFYTDLLRYLDKHRGGGTVTTPAVSVLYALDRQLEVILEEGLEARWQRHLGLGRQTAEWVERRGLAFASAAAARSPTISCIRAPEGMDARDVVAGLQAEGVVIGGGYGQWKPSTFRIGHMGEIRTEDLDALFRRIDSLLEG